ncbi:MAG: AMP-binding protein, partial [Crocinitomicaceae bacterium]|nr:AMP-binding protein [Crocinitomicaceae bacterium]
MEKIKRLFDIPYFQLDKFPQETMFSSKIDGKWQSLSTKDFLNKVNENARGLVALGIAPGDKVGLVSANRVEWNIMDIAIQQVGAIGVPIYPNISVKDYRFIFSDANIKLCATSTKELYDKINSIKDELPALKYLYCFDQEAGTPN